jgi:hypothetical protein
MYKGETRTLSLETPRRVILYALFCMIELALVMAIVAASLMTLSRYG